jgi:CheY-like chemotaxis protein
MPIAELSFLAVEDHVFQRRVLLRMLAGLGAKIVFAAADGREALKIVSARNPPVDIIISDIQMPGMDGEEFMHHLGDAGTKASIILTSALGALTIASVETLTRSYGLRLLGVIEKPVTPPKLAALINLHERAQPKQDTARTRTQAAGPSFTLEGFVEGLKKKLRPAAPVERSVLGAISGGDAAAEREILADFRRVNDADADRLKLAVDRHDIPELSSAADCIKGASRTIGALALAAVCEHLEHASRASDWKAIGESMGAFQRELERLNSYCDEAKWALPS